MAWSRGTEQSDLVRCTDRVQSPVQRRGVCCTRSERRGVFRVRAPSVISSPSLSLAACSPRSSSGRAHGESERIPWPPRPRPTNTLSPGRSLARSLTKDLRERGAERSGADPRESVRVPCARRAGDRR